MDIPAKISERLSQFQRIDFAERELQRRFDCAERNQRAGRERRAAEHRELVSSVVMSEGKTEAQELPYQLKKYYVTQFMTEEWLTHPRYIDSSSWLLTPRPLGVRCLLVASQGITLSITRNGALLHSFQSSLPNGSEKKGSSNEYTVLDSIYNEECRCFYVLDVMTWHGTSFYDHPADFRLLLSRQYLRDLEDEPSDISLSAAPIYPCNPDSIRSVYETEFPFRKDGLLFYKETGEYVLGVTPDVMVWKDSGCSPYPIDQGGKHRATLHLGTAGRLTTLDKIILCTLPEPVISSYTLHPGMLIVMEIDGVDMTAEVPTVINPVFVRVASRKKMKADQWSRILFQHIARCGGISLQDLLTASSSPEGLSPSSAPVPYSSGVHIGQQSSSSMSLSPV